MSTAAANSSPSGPPAATVASMTAQPASVMAAAAGTTRCWPRSSTSLDMRGEMRNVASAMVDDTSPAMRNDRPASVIMVMVPMFIM